MEIEVNNEVQPRLIRVTKEQVELVVSLFDSYRQFYDQTPNLEGAGRFLADRLSRGESVIFAVVEKGRALIHAALPVILVRVDEADLDSE